MRLRRRQLPGLLSALLVLLPATAFAHPVDAPSLATWATAAPLLVVGGIFAAGFLRQGGKRRWGSGALFAGGWLVLAAALLGPLEHAADASVAAHMIQHMLLLAVAPPLLIAARPLPVLLRGLPRMAAGSVAILLNRLYQKAIRHPVAAFTVHGITIWAWHMPMLYQAAQQSTPLHYIEHATFLVSSLWFWSALLAPPVERHVGPLRCTLWALLTVMHTGMLGALLTFAPVPLYPAHPTGLWGLDPLQDQQLAGLVMWVPGGIAYIIAAVAPWIRWLEAEGARTAG